MIRLLLIAVSFAIPASGRQLVWTDPNPPGVVSYFNVYQSPVMPPIWVYVGSVEATEIDIPDNGPQMFYTVAAVTPDGEFPEIQTAR